MRISGIRIVALVTCAGLAAVVSAADVTGNGQVSRTQVGSGGGVSLLPLPGPDAPISPTAIYFAHGTIDTSVARPFGAFAEPLVVGNRYLVQLDGPITPARRAAIEAAGLSLGDYLPAHAYIAKLERLDPNALAQLGMVRYVATFQDGWKISPEFNTRPFLTPERQALRDAGIARLVVTLFDGEPSAPVVQAIGAIPGAMVTGVQSAGTQHDVLVTMPVGMVGRLPGIASVQFVEDAPEIQFRNATTKWIIQTNVSGSVTLWDNGLRGSGQIIGIMDGRMDRNHCSFLDSNPIGPTHRKIVAYNTSFGSDFHGTHVAGTAAGDNGANDDTRGIAYQAKIAFNTIPSFSDTAMYSALQTHHNQGARNHTNSWGDDGTTSYNSLARGIDRFSYDFEDSLVMLAVTNGSSLRNPENAKNLLAVGASQDTPNQASHCSGGTGPTADGRRKPEIYAPGCSTRSSLNGSGCSTTTATGTSMASPAIGGLGALIRQYFTDGYYPSGAATVGDGFTPTGALVKATMLNSAVDMTGVTGYPSNREGWGRALADEALHFAGETRRLVVNDVRNADGLSTGEFDEIPFTVNSASQKLKVTVVWTEPPASASTGTGNATTNNLDVEVISPSGTIYKGNVFSGGISIEDGTADAKNNVEQVHVVSPQTGNWVVRVKGTAVNVGTQGYAVAITGAINPPAPPSSIVITPDLPSVVAPGVATEIQVTLTPDNDTLVGTPTFHYRLNGGGFTSAPMSLVGGEVWAATLPAATCDDSPEFYFTATGASSGTNTLPPGGASDPFSTDVGTAVTVFADDFETDQGWTVGSLFDSATSGVWVRAIPTGGLGAPTADRSPDGEYAFITGVDGDVDGGITTLVSPTIDMTGPGSHTVSYWRWYSNSEGANPNADVFAISISNNNGASWSPIETVGPAGPGTSGGWNQVSFDPASVLPLTATMKLRFLVSDTSGDSNVEAAIDDVLVERLTCTDPSDCIADYNADGGVDVLDFLDFIEDFGSCDGQPGPCGAFGNADVNNDGGVDVLDLLEFLDLFSQGCGG